MGIQYRSYPMQLSPVLKDYLWGGARLKRYLPGTDAETIAEGWMLSAHRDGQTAVRDGELAGRNIGDIIRTAPKRFLGSRGRDELPLIVKLIDADKDLSIQVHPTLEESAKSELWVVVDALPGSILYCGFKRDLSREDFLEHLEAGTVCSLINRIPVEKGDLVYIPAGTIHALGKGIVVAEIQQNSNTTYRIYDYLRKDAEGNLRPLHIEKALEVLDFRAGDRTVRRFEEDNLFRCEHFAVEKADIAGVQKQRTDGSSFHSLLFLEGSGEILYGGEGYPFQGGDSFFIPADLGDYAISGQCICLITTI